MLINDLIKEKSISKYRLSKNSGIPYTTINDICSGKTRLEKCSAETIYKIAKELGVTMETLIEPCFENRCKFDLFRSNVCHQVKKLGDTEFIIETLEKDDIYKYYLQKWYPECLYLLAMLDYISNENQVPLCTKYNELRKCKLKDTLFPSGIELAAAVAKDNSIKEFSVQNAIPEFKQFNIIESEVRDVI